MATLHRPDPILRPDVPAVDRGIPPRDVARRLAAGSMGIVTDAYGTGADILDALVDHLQPPPAGAPFEARQAYQAAYRAASLRLLAPVVDHRVALENAAPIGFLAELYPELDRFALPLVELQDLHGAWRRYVDGVPMPVLGRSLHPFYGTYVPRRMLHLELFATWLSQYRGPRDRAVDVGTGCGVLALQLARAGFAQVRATDCNPNAIESVRRELAQHEEPPAVTLECTDLLGEGDDRADLVVFNPPWIQGRVASLLDRARIFEAGLFERFFDQVQARVQPGGRVVLLFSNLIRLSQPGVPHPIDAELERGRFTLIERMQRRVKKPGTGRRRNTKERVEVWELAPAPGALSDAPPSTVAP